MRDIQQIKQDHSKAVSEKAIEIYNNFVDNQGGRDILQLEAIVIFGAIIITISEDNMLLKTMYAPDLFILEGMIKDIQERIIKSEIETL
jgi:hypothetical protein